MNEFTEFDPIGDSKEAIEHSFDSTPNTEAITEGATPVAEESAKSDKSELPKSEPSKSEPAAESAAAPGEITVEIPLPEPVVPVTTEDLAPITPPLPKPAEGSA